MTSATINSIIARCIVDTTFLEQLASDPPAALNDYALDPQIYSDFLRLDIDRLRKFAGLVTKVQNNGLWEYFVHTRTLLNFYHIDLEVFTAYRDTHLQNRHDQLSRNQQIQRFLSFLGEYLKGQYPSYPALREVLAHEQLTWEVRVSFSTNKPLQAITHKVDISALNYDQLMHVVPLVSGLLRVEEFTYSPLEVISKLTRGNFDPQGLLFGPTWLGYWADISTEQLRILDLDPSIAELLKQVNGRRSIRTLIRRAIKGCPAAVRPSEFRPFLETAFREELLIAVPPNPVG